MIKRWRKTTWVLIVWCITIGALIIFEKFGTHRHVKCDHECTRLSNGLNNAGIVAIIAVGVIGLLAITVVWFMSGLWEAKQGVQIMQHKENQDMQNRTK